MLKHLNSRMVIRSGLFMAASFLGASGAFASPLCEGFNGQDLPINDAQVVAWKQTTANETHERAHVEGPLLQVYPDETGHQHFEIQIGPNEGETLEVIYEMSYGEATNLAPGALVEACGDYITSNAPFENYPISPDGALIHWVHTNGGRGSHPSGFLIVGGYLYGQ